MFKAEFHLSALTDVPQNDGQWVRVVENELTRVEVIAETGEEAMRTLRSHVEVQYLRYGPSSK